MVKTCYFKRIINERIIAESTQNINMKACLCMFTHTHTHTQRTFFRHYTTVHHTLSPAKRISTTAFYSFCTFIIKVFLAFMPQD